MVQLTRSFVISRIFFMGFLISGAALAQTSPIEPVSAASSTIDAAAPDDAVGQAIQATLEPLRSAVGVVPQDAYLFHDTIRANLAYARPDATVLKRVRQALNARG